ncbi:secretin N-terminal domain-containing protein [Cupriavidus sp. H39]|uniref:secretin N-terminal domain-containing protein n=1 Tax=Cupriavidus sp. H39 TaxID=3401635 RepID=UPI003D000DA0
MPFCRRAIFILVLCTLFSACATQVAIQDAKQLYGQGKVEESLLRLKAALDETPTNPELRTVYLALRDRAVANWIAQADAAHVRGDQRNAEASYRRVLAVEPGNARAKSGLQLLERTSRHAKLLQEAENAIRKKEDDSGRAILRAILSEDPANPTARRLLSALEERSAKPPVDTQLSAALKKTLSLDFKDAMLKQVFEIFSRTASVNFVFDKDVRGDQKTTVFLKGTTIKEAIDVVLLTNQLEQRVLDRNTILIYPNTPAKLKDYQTLAVRSFFLASADAEQVANTLKTILKTRDVIVDKKQNMLVMRDTSDAIRLAERLVTLHDLPEPEVMLEVEILEVNRNRLLELGIKFPEQLSLSPLPTTTGGSVTLHDLLHLTSRGIAATISPLNINARGVDGDVNLLANPRIRARNRETAKILIGDRVPNITSTSTATGFVAENVQYLDVGLKLDVTPVISIDNEIAIKISLEVSNIANQIKTTSGTLAYQIGTRTASTVLRLKDGENQVLAGLISDEDRRTINKLPGFGDIPLAGRLFSSRLSEVKKNEIVLSITPHLIRNTPRPELSLLEFYAGTESSLRGLSARAAADVGSAPDAGTPGGQNAVTSSSLGPPSRPGAAAGAIGSNGVLPSASGESPPGAGAASGLLRWQAPAQVKVGEQFSAQLWMQPQLPVTSIPYALAFDPKLIEVLAVSEGDLLKHGGSPTAFNHRVDRQAGQIFVTNTRTSPNQSGGAGTLTPGTLLTLSLRATAPADATQLQVTTIAPIGENGTSVNVPVPTPQSITVVP